MVIYLTKKFKQVK